MNAYRFPVWASLAQDYLSIMAASVSSERAFSQGGITITKRRNRLKADIVEALQFLKCSLRQDLIFREPALSSSLDIESDEEVEVLDGDPKSDGRDSGAEDSWEGFLIHDEDTDLEYF
jgi:hypothetical protein